MLRYLLLLLLFSLPTFAELKPGTYTALDEFGYTPAPNESSDAVKKYKAYLQQTKRGGQLHIHSLDPFDLIFPANTVDGKDEQVAPLYDRYVFEALMDSDIRGSYRTYHAKLAKSVTILPDGDGHTVLIDLRDDVRFSDGSLMTAKDVVYSWKVFVEKEMGEAFAHEWKDRTGEVQLSEKGPHQVSVHFDVPEGKFRNAVWVFVAWFNIVKDNTSGSPDIQLKNPYIGTGPYQYVAASRTSATLRRRSDYWDRSTPLFNFDEIKVDSYRDITVVREAFLAHQLNYYQENRAQNEAILDDKLTSSFFRKNSISILPDSMRSSLLHMNMSHEHTGDLRFREAMTLLYNAEDIFHNLYADSFTRLPSLWADSDFSPHGAPTPAVSALFAGDPQEELLNRPFESAGMYNLNQQLPTRDRMRRAMQLLREAGYQSVGPTLMKNGRPVELEAVFHMNQPEEKAISGFAAVLGKLGIQLNLRPVPDDASLIATKKANHYDFILAGSLPRKLDVLDPDYIDYRFVSEFAVDRPGTQSNMSNMHSPLIDSLNIKLKVEDPNSERYRQLSEAILRVVSMNVPFIMMGEETTKAIYTEKDLCLPPFSSARIWEAAYISPTGSCPL